MTRAEKIALRVWELMIEGYGKQFVDRYGSEPNQVWTEAISEFDEKLIGPAIKQCIKHKQYSPSLSEFLQFIKEQREYASDADERKKHIELTPEQREAGKAAIKKAAPARKAKSRRSVLKPFESYDDFKSAMLASGLGETEFRMQRLKENGWTDKDEETFLHHLQSIGQINKLGPNYN